MASVPPSTPFTFLVRRTPGGGIVLGVLNAIAGSFAFVVGIFFVLTILTITGVVTGLAIFAPLGVGSSTLPSYGLSAALFIVGGVLSLVAAAGLLTTRGFTRIVAASDTVISIVGAVLFVVIVLLFIPTSIDPANVTNTTIAIIAPTLLAVVMIVSLGYLTRPRIRVIYETAFRPFSAASFLGTPPVSAGTQAFPAGLPVQVPQVPTGFPSAFPPQAPFGFPASVGFPATFGGIPTGVPSFGGFGGSPFGASPFGGNPFAFPFGIPVSFYRGYPYPGYPAYPGFRMSTMNEPGSAPSLIRPVPIPVGTPEKVKGSRGSSRAEARDHFCRHCGSKVSGTEIYCDHCGGRVT